MSEFYKAQRTRNLYRRDKPYRLSRSKLDLFLNCPRCFYADRKLGVSPPPSFPFTLNSAVDELLKREFDRYRAKGRPHPLMEINGIDAIPFAHPSLNDWRDSLHKGIQFLHKKTNLLITGGVDDVWTSSAGELIIVDYKATSKKSEVNLNADWQIGYKRQMEIYQWLFRKNGFRVSNTGYFVYCNGNSNKESFEQKLEFSVSIIPYQGSDEWIEEIICSAHDCLNEETIPDFGFDCDLCSYTHALTKKVGLRL